MMQELLTGRIRLVDADGKEQPKPQAVQEKQLQTSHNQYFDDAVMIAGIVNAFYSEKYPLGRKKVQKLLYRNRSIIPRYRKPWFPALTLPRTTTSFLLTRGVDHPSQIACAALRAQAIG